MRKKYLDGLRVIFCFIVVIHHFCLAFFPNIPIFILNDGNLAVMYFLILSGFVTPIKIFSEKQKGNIFLDTVKYIIKRYFRLLPFILITILISYFLLKFNLYFSTNVSLKFNLSNIGNYFNEKVLLSTALYDSFIGTFYRRPLLNTPLWTIHYEFIGVVILYIVVKLFHNNRKRYIYYSLVLLMTFILLKDIYYSCIIIGGILSDYLYNDKEKNNYLLKFQKYFSNIFILPIIILILCVLTLFGRFLIYLRFIISILIIIFVSYNKKIQKLLENSNLQYFSKYSTEIYAVHWIIICSFSCYMYLFLEKYNFTVISVIIFLISLVIIWIMAKMLNKADNLFNKITQKFLKKCGIV